MAEGDGVMTFRPRSSSGRRRDPSASLRAGSAGPAGETPALRRRACFSHTRTAIGVADSILTSRAFSPAVFCGGEEPALSERSESKGADRRMRGRRTRMSFAYPFCRSRTRGGRSRLSRIRPPHPPSAPSPPARNRGGRRTLDEKGLREVQADCEECGL